MVKVVNTEERRDPDADPQGLLKELADLKFALDQAAIVATTDQRGRITYVNDKFCEISKYSRDELLGQDHRIINSNYHSKEFIRNIWSTIAGGKVWRGELRNRAKDGSIYWVDTTIVPFIDDNGKPFRYVSIRYEITERKLAEERIRQQADILNKTQDAVIVCDLNYRIIFWNRGAQTIYGWETAEVIGRDIADVLFPDGNDELELILTDFADAGVWAGEVSRLSKDKVEIKAKAHWTLVTGEHGQPDYVLIVHTDITDQKRTEQHLLRAQRMESIGTLAGGIAHDLNNILSPIMMAVEMMQLEDLNADQRRWLSMIYENVDRGANLVKQVLTFARGMDGERVSVQVKHIIKDLINVLVETLPKDIHLKFELEPDLWPISADPTQIHQVLMNICLNARDAMQFGGELKIEAKNVEFDENFVQLNPDAKPGPYIVLIITDTGSGMTPDVMSRIFDPFYTTKEVGKGTGLGLSITHSIVQSHGGFLNVYSEPKKGSRFSIYLPSLTVESQTFASKDSAAFTRGNGEVVLVVDDENNVREITKATLEKFGYRVLTAADGADAIAVYSLHKNELSVLLTDMAMPLLDGIGAIRAIRRADPKIKIVAMSGILNAEQISELEGLGVTYLLTKPFSADELLSTLGEILGK